MSETLRDLVVSLSLNSDNFSRNIRSVTAQIKEAESGFKLAGAGVKDFETTTSGLTAKLAMLESKLSLQKSAVGQYEGALTAANTKLKESVANNEKMKATLEANKAKYAELGDKVFAASVRYDMWNRALGEGHQETIAAKAELDALEKEYAELGAEIKKNEGQLLATQKTMQNAADSVSKATTNLNGAKTALKETEAAIKKCNSALKGMNWTKAGAGLTALSKELGSASKAFTSFGKSMSAMVTAPITALGGYAIKSAIEFEDAFAGVRKTVDATEARFEELQRDIKNMSLEVPSNTTTIASVMEMAGQLGIANDHLTQFTRTMIDLSNSTDMAATDAASSIAKFVNITNMKQSEISNLGAAIVDLGNNYATTESSLMSMAMRLASAGSQVGLSESQILGFAAALSSVGMEAEAGGSAFSKAMIKMQVAVETNSKALKDFSKVSGMSVQQFKDAWKRDPAEAIQAFIVGLSKMSEQGVSAIATLEDMGLKEVRLRDTLMRATNASELFSKAVNDSNKAWKENTALTKEAETRYGTLKSQLEMMKNKATLFAQAVGDDMTPTIRRLMGDVGKLMDSFMKLDKSQRESMIITAAKVAAIGPAFSILGSIMNPISKVTEKLGKFAKKVGEADGGLKGLKTVIGSSKLAMFGFYAALGVGLYLLYDWASGARACREALEGMNATADKWRYTQSKTLYSNEGLGFFGLTKENFAASTMTSKKWLADVITVWSDGREETEEIVNGYTESFTAMTEKTKTALGEMRETAKAGGHTKLADEIQKDMDKLDKVNKEIGDLLKKKRNKKLTEKDKIRLQELIDTKETIEIKYKLTPEETNGYAQILEGIETEVARAQARGQKGVDASVYATGLTAAAQGHAAVAREIDARYDAEYALIKLIEDEEERAQARLELDERYNTQRKEAAEEYANTIRELIGPVWEQEGIQKASQDMDELMTLFREYSTLGEKGYKDPEILKKMQQLTDGMDKDQLLNYLGVLQQVQALLDSGMTEAEVKAMFPDIDFTQQLDQFAALADFAKNRSGELQGLSDILNGIVPEEMKKLAVELDMTAVEARWAEFASNPGAITTDVIIQGYSDGPEAVVPEAVVDGLVEAYKEIDGGASTVQLTPDDVVAQVASYLESEGADISALKPDQVEAIVDAYSEATGADKDELLKAFQAKIASYDDTNAVKPKGPLNMKIAVTGYDRQALDEFKKNNPVEVTGVVRLGEKFEQPTDVLDDPNAKFYVNGKQIEVDVVPKNKLTADTVFVYDADGTMHVMVTPEIKGTPESTDNAFSQLNKGDTKINTAWGGTSSKGSDFMGGLFNTTITGNMDSMIGSLKWFLDNRGSITDLWGLLDGKNREGLNNQLGLSFVAEDWAAIQAAVQEAITALNNGQEISAQAMADLEKIQQMVSLMDAAGVGQNVVAGIGDAMEQAGWSPVTDTVAGNLEAALNGSFQINSPSKLVMPVGTGVAEGIGQGMTEHSMAAAANTVASNVTSALRGALTPATMSSIGRFAMSGLALGILSGRASVVAAIRSVARSAVVAAKSELVIKSPSAVFRDEVGRMMTKGMAQGALLESKRQAKVIANAARYLTGAAQMGVSGMIASDNRRTITNNANAQVSVQNLYVRDERDVYSIAVEIAQLTKRRQAAVGVRA